MRCPIQKVHWTAGHKKACRPPSELKAGDVVLAIDDQLEPSNHPVFSSCALFFILRPSSEGNWVVSPIDDQNITLEVSFVRNSMRLLQAVEERAA